MLSCGMAKNLFVGGLPFSFSKDDLEKIFAACGTVASANIVMDRETGRPKGFGFVEMSTEEEAKAAILKFNGSNVGPRKLFVTEARPSEKRPGGLPAMPASAAKPGFVERRSGVKDRRRQAAADRAGEKEWKKKPWGKKPGVASERKPWEKKPWEKKPAFGAEKKPWEKKPAFGGEKKAWEKRPGFGGKSRPWEKKPAFGAKKNWGSKPGGLTPGKKPGGRPKHSG